MKIVLRDDDLNFDFFPESFTYYDEVKDFVRVSFFCIPFIDFSWKEYLDVCESVGPGSDPKVILDRMIWYESSRPIWENMQLAKYLKKNIDIGSYCIGLHGSKHYQTLSEQILPRNYSFGAEYLFKDFDENKIKMDVECLRKIDRNVLWFAPPQNLISLNNFKQLAKMGLNITVDLNILKRGFLFLGLHLKDLSKMFYWKVIKGIRFYYPFVLNYHDVKILSVLRLNTSTDIKKLLDQVLKLEREGGEVVVINTHLSAFDHKCIDGNCLGENMICLMKELKALGKFEFVTINDV